ncbi:TonB-dependent receptor [uncultured Phocaeicola sp.]|uniref:SusC/RagA family TonB-linked outer membrane protein n=1 Tax=uncultured Phocaeicola sp. TaxID=990718 RepID=UPI0025E2322E|nr:TonB-dependent receptor [uncultured Phocaeicola sp.]
MKQLLFLCCFTLVSLCGFAQQITVKGIVTSDADKLGLIGATVQIKGTTVGTITGLDGDYTLNNVPSDAVLVFSSIGYETQEIPVNGRTTINLVMKEATELLDEVVVIGYGAVKKSDLTSSISTVKGEEITETVTGNAMDALQGKVNGVQVASGGGPGTTPKVLIRGVTTVNGSDPLYVVDGMPISGNINFLNSNDIESMQVLKDASAAAIYGTRASNGVILITTKKGKAGQTRVNFTASVGFQTIAKPKVANAAEYKEVFLQANENIGRDPMWNDTGATTNPGGTDWWDTVVNKTALTQNYALSISGGTDKLVYNLSLGYYRTNSQFDVGYWDKLNARLNTEYTFNKYVKVGFDIAPRMESWDDTSVQFSSAMAMDPTTPVFRPESEWEDNEYNNYERSYNNQTWNPAASIARQNAHSREMGAIINTYLQINPIEKLTLRTQFGANAHFRRSDSFTPQFYMDALEQQTLSRVERDMTEWLDWNWTNTVTYIDTFAEKHNLNVMAGFTAERYAEYTSVARRDDTPSNMDVLQEVHAGTEATAWADGNTQYNTLVSFLGRVMYNYDNRYYISASLRSDGSSRFPKGNKYALFPAVSASWRITSEEFMQDQDIFSDLKLRGGWGRVGNQNISNNATLTLLDQTYYMYGNTIANGYFISSVGNNNLKWETVEDWNVGIDMSLLKSRLGVTFEYFQKKSMDMLYQKQNVHAIGYPSWNNTVWMNIGSMKATGWELGLSWRDQVGKDFSYDIGVNLSAVRNKAIKFSGDGPIYTGGFNSDQIISNEDGGLISRFYGYVADGLFQNWEEVYAHTDEHGTLIQPNAQPGDIRFKDLDHNGVLDANDKTFIGNPYPDLMMGINIGLRYKNIDFAANFYGTFGNDIFNKTKGMYSGINGQNVWAGTLDKAWHGEGTSNDIPRLTYNDVSQNYERVSSFYVEDGSYMRCKLLQIGYTLPEKWVGDSQLRLSFSAQNPFTITGYSGMDPERPALDGSVIETGIDNTAYPSPRTFLFGIDFKF